MDEPHPGDFFHEGARRPAGRHPTGAGGGRRSPPTPTPSTETLRRRIALVGAALDSTRWCRPPPDVRGTVRNGPTARLQDRGGALTSHLEAVPPGGRRGGRPGAAAAGRAGPRGTRPGLAREDAVLPDLLDCGKDLARLLHGILRNLDQRAIGLLSSEPTQRITEAALPISIATHILSCLTSSSFSPEEERATKSIRRHIVEEEGGLLSELVTIADAEKFCSPIDDKSTLFEIVSLARMYAINTVANLACDPNLRALVVSHPRLLFVLCETVHEMHGKAETGASSDPSSPCHAAEGRILESVAEALKSLTLLDRDLYLATRKRLVQALVLLMSKKDGGTAKIRRCAAGAVHNLSSFEPNRSLLVKHGNHQLFATLSKMASDDEDSSVRLASASALQKLACNEDVTEHMANNFSAIINIAQAASAPNDIVGEHASAALHKLVPFLSAKGLRIIMTHVALASSPPSANAIRHDLMVPSEE